MVDSTTSGLNFIERIVEDDLANGVLMRDDLRFRFPPEPNGYLHIGHAKAIAVSFGLGKRYDAPVNLRFDDTNPSKEDIRYEDAIKEDISWLGYRWDKVCYASDYFQQLYDWALILISKGRAYVDSQPSEVIAVQKGTPTQAGVNSPFRERSIEENLELFQGMKEGKYKEGSHVLRAKIDMSSSNMLMRDPIMYRILFKEHHRTGNLWCIYPTYDWTHGQSDYIERISHSLCSLEFAMHRELYDWFLDRLCDGDSLRPKQREFARLNLNYTVMSKRKLMQLVDEGVVSGWDDPRMPTISGLRRRGCTPESIQNFCATVGVAKRDNQIDMSLLEFCVRDHLNEIAPRVMAVMNPVKVIITNYPEDREEWLQAEDNPEVKDMTYREVPFSGEIYIEREDFREEANRKFFRLKLGGEVRLKNAYIIKAHSVKKNDIGDIEEIYATYDKLSKSGSGTPESLRKVKATLHWVSVKHAVKARVNSYDRLFTEAEPDSTSGGFMSCVNSDSLKVVEAYVEPSLKNAKVGDRYQFRRLGYFCVGIDSTRENISFYKTVDLKDTWTKKNTE